MGDLISRNALGIGKCKPEVFENKAYGGSKPLVVHGDSLQCHPLDAAAGTTEGGITMPRCDFCSRPVPEAFGLIYGTVCRQCLCERLSDPETTNDDIAAILTAEIVTD